MSSTRPFMLHWKMSAATCATLVLYPTSRQIAFTNITTQSTRSSPGVEKPLKIENMYLFERLRATDQTLAFERTQFPAIGRGILNDHIIRSKINWQFTPQLSLRLILQYNSLLAGTPGVGSPYTYLPTSKQFNADFLITYLVHPGTAIYIGYNSDLQNLDVVRSTPGFPGSVTNTRNGFLNDSRQFFVKVSYMFRF